MGDGFSGDVYEATETTVTPLYRKIAGPGLALISMSNAMVMNIALWSVVWAAVAAIRRRRARDGRVPTTPTAAPR